MYPHRSSVMRGMPNLVGVCGLVDRPQQHRVMTFHVLFARARNATNRAKWVDH